MSTPPGRVETPARIYDLPELALRTLFDKLTSRRGRLSKDGFALASTCRRLNEFYRHEYIVSMDGVPVQEISRALARLPRVTRLDLGAMEHSLLIIRSALVGGPSSPERCARLRVLNLSHCELSDEGLREIAIVCPRLVWLDISYTRVADEGVLFVVQKLRQTLKSLFLEQTDITDTSGVELSKLSLVRHLSVASCRRLTDTTYSSFVHMTQLREIDLARTKLTTMTICNILGHLPRLHSLTLGACPAITSMLWLHLPDTLRRLDIYNLDILSDEAVADMFLRCPRLIEFRAGGFSGLSGMSGFSGCAERLRALEIEHVEAFCDNDAYVLRDMHRLISLDFTGCQSVGDRTLRAIASLSSLVTLELGGTGVTDDGLLAFSQGTSKHHLGFLDLSSCNGVTANGPVAELRAELLSRGGNFYL